ncbi:conserved exported hypothetical protein [Vibrio crassostreae]|uniref:hypothetical protein n=1 Tax=Vibrio crassostreae TaxID=246167 RepID=UPI0005E5221D|nr:hypothetical protein [Vibrio crassostreae]TCT64249.1 hypothetical protein EDB44_10577 [Vibrio crassostreae]TCT84485.1 hypothetical protein EDB43_10577 [Vibrio crassostreae]TCU05852.1 hypothetical protein EDB47_105248 [Vibrio crassostreae]TDW13019.1 hypothetical protein EDB45_102378 [Vibrio crassostreae]CAK1852578.1 conserved exported hypothetical protein [Vibrio crassostreae]
MKNKNTLWRFAAIIYSPISVAFCLSDDVQDTQSLDAINQNRITSWARNEVYSEPQFGIALGELEQDAHTNSFSAAWPQTEQALASVPQTFESPLSEQSLLSRLGKAGSSTLEVLGPIGDAVAVGFWLDNMVSTFSQESSTRLDEAASVFSIIPLVGDELNLLSNDIKYFAAKEKIEEFESQTHYVFSDHSSEFYRFHHKKEDAIVLLNKYDNHVLHSASMYVDHLLLEADTEYRRLTSAYDRQLSKQMARIDLELLKSIGHLSPDSNLNQPLCQNGRSSLTEIERCIRTEGPARIDDLINNLNADNYHALALNIHSKKKELVEIALHRLSTHRENIVKRLIERAKPHVASIITHSRINRSTLEFQVRQSGLREYANEAWGLDYLSEEQLKTATFEVRPARECWGIPAIVPGGIQASVDACKESGPLYDTYHPKKDPELSELLMKRVDFNVEQYIAAKIIYGWPAGLFRIQLINTANAYISGQSSNKLFEELVSELTEIQILSYQTPFVEYLENKGIDSSDPNNHKNWYQISRWYELLLTERPSGGVLDQIKQYEIFKHFIQPQFKLAISMSYIRSLNYSIPFPSVYSAANLRFYAPQMADILDNVMSQPSAHFERNFQSAIDSITEKAMKATSANQLQYLLGDLSLYLQIAQHQQSESNISTNSKHQLFNSTLSPLHLSYLSQDHQDTIAFQIGEISTHQLWSQLADIKSTLSQGDIQTAVTQLGVIVKEDDFTMLPHINHLLLRELEDWIEIQLALEE